MGVDSTQESLPLHYTEGHTSHSLVLLNTSLIIEERLCGSIDVQGTANRDKVELVKAKPWIKRLS